MLSFAFYTPLFAATSKEDEQKQLQKEIKSLSSTLEQKKDQYDDAANEVTKLEKELGRITNEYHQTELKIDDTKRQINEANAQGRKLDQEIAIHKNALAQQLQAMNTTGGQSHLRMLLRQDDPSDISRTFYYYGALNKHRTQRINSIRSSQAKLQASREEARVKQKQLDQLTQKLETQKKAIQSTLATRETKLGSMKQDIRYQERQLSKLKAEEAELNKLLERLERQRQEAERQKARERELARQKAQAAQEAARREKQAQAQTKTQAQIKVARPTPAKPTAPASAKTVPVAATFTPKQSFASLRGKLRWPTQGKILYKYRSVRNERRRWNGVVLQAAGGAPVRSIAAGRVAFAGWVNGYGHLIMIEHDRNYISLYGYNRAIYKREGQIVRANEVIASVGNSGGQAQNGLYFEIRNGKTPQNPALWCR